MLEPGHRAEAAAIALAFGSALAVHFLLGAPNPAALQRDAAGYDALAVSLATGRGYVSAAGHVEVLRTPGYPAFLALHYAAFGHRLAPIWVSHAVLHAATTFLMAPMARALLRTEASSAQLTEDPRLPRAAMLSFALYPFALHAGSRILTESLATFLLVLVSVFSLRRSWALSGLAAGALALVRPVFVLFPFALALVVALERRHRALPQGRIRDAIGPAAWVVGPALVLMLPWAIRTSIIVGQPVLLGAAGVGNNLHIAAWEYRDLSSGIPSTTDFSQPGFWQNDGAALAASDAQKDSPRWVVEVDRARLQLAIEEIRSHPLLYLRACALRVVKLWTSQHLPRLPSWMGGVAAAACLALLGLGLGGALILRKRGWDLVFFAAGPLYLWLMHIPLHAEARYTIPARPHLVLLAVVALAWTFRNTLRERRVP